MWARAALKASRRTPLDVEETRALQLGPDRFLELTRTAQRVLDDALLCRDLRPLLCRLLELNALAGTDYSLLCGPDPHVVPYPGG